MWTLEDFVRESNRIEGILRDSTEDEIAAHGLLMALDKITVPDLEIFVAVVQPGARLRRELGWDVRVGNHIAPPGGPIIETQLEELLARDMGAYHKHNVYETLHPFTDGNGRSGRVLWLWQMGGIEHAPLGFLHQWYYQSLEAVR